MFSGSARSSIRSFHDRLYIIKRITVALYNPCSRDSKKVDKIVSEIRCIMDESINFDTEKYEYIFDHVIESAYLSISQKYHILKKLISMGIESSKESYNIQDIAVYYHDMHTINILESLNISLRLYNLRSLMFNAQNLLYIKSLWPRIPHKFNAGYISALYECIRNAFMFRVYDIIDFILANMPGSCERENTSKHITTHASRLITTLFHYDDYSCKKYYQILKEKLHISVGKIINQLLLSCTLYNLPLSFSMLLNDEEFVLDPDIVRNKRYYIRMIYRIVNSQREKILALCARVEYFKLVNHFMKKIIECSWVAGAQIMVHAGYASIKKYATPQQIANWIRITNKNDIEKMKIHSMLLTLRNPIS